MDFDASRLRWHAHIARWGGGVDNGYLIRSGIKRRVTMGLSEYSPRERGLFADGAVRFMISALKNGGTERIPLDEVPTPDLDVIEFAGRRFNILMLPQGAQPDGTWIAFDTPGILIGFAPFDPAIAPGALLGLRVKLQKPNNGNGPNAEVT